MERRKQRLCKGGTQACEEEEVKEERWEEVKTNGRSSKKWRGEESRGRQKERKDEWKEGQDKERRWDDKKECADERRKLRRRKRRGGM